MLTGISKDILDAYQRGEATPGITKGLLTELLSVHKARVSLEWATPVVSGRPLHEREQVIMGKIEQYIIKKLSM